LSFFSKTLVSVIIRRSFGRQFHSAGPEKEKALNSLYCADVPLSNYSLTHSLTHFVAHR